MAVALLDVDIVRKDVPGRDRPRTVIADLRFGLAPDEIVALVGPSGCGKSTLLRMVGGLDTHFADGRAFLLGDQLSAADFIPTMLARWSRNMARPATDWPHLRGYVDRMRAVPSLRETHDREGLADWV